MLGGAELWAEKYRPKRIDQMCFPAGANKLKMFLESFDINNKDHKRAALLSGPPGVGKTTTVHVVAAELGLRVIEYNASDHRSKRTLHENVSGLTNNQTIGGAGGSRPATQHAGRSDDPLAALLGSRPATATAAAAPKKVLPWVKPGANFIILMDEVDGCDRGGVSEIIQMIKTTTVPILCTCNDRWHQKLRSLVNHVEDMRFTRPPCNLVASYICDKVLSKEGVVVPKDLLQEIIKSQGSDIRSALSNLQMWCLTQRRGLDQKQLVACARTGFKNETFGMFDTPELFLKVQTPPKTFEELQSAFYGADLVDLFIQENYIHFQPKTGDWMTAVAKAAKSISEGDRVSKAIFTEQNWALSNTHLVLAAVYPAAMVRGDYQSFLTGPAAGFDKARPIKFPMWLGSNSSAGKNQRLLQCVAREGGHPNGGLSGNTADVATDYIPLGLSPALAQPLVEQDKAGIAPVTRVMEQYHLQRDDWDFIQEVGVFKKMKAPPGCPHLAASIPTATKSAFTREFNKTHKFDNIAKTSLKGGGGASAGSQLGYADEDGVAGGTGEDIGSDGDEEKEDSQTASAAAKKPAAKAAAKAPSRAGAKAKAAAAAATGKGDVPAPAPKPAAKAKKSPQKRPREPIEIDSD